MTKKALYLISGLAIVGAGLYFYYRYKSKNTQQILPPIDTSINPVTKLIETTALDIKSMTNAGIRNNNPLNIKWDANSRKDPWLGQTGESGKFVVFKDPKYGFRAAARILRTYADKYNARNIASIIAKWAPASDNNDVKAYTNFVSKETGILSFTPITIKDYPKVLQAMGRMETGKTYPIEQIVAGVTIMDSKI